MQPGPRSTFRVLGFGWSQDTDTWEVTSETQKRKRVATGKLQGWAESVVFFAGVAHKHPQSAYAGPKNSLQQEWAFVQTVTPGFGNAFGPLEVALKEIFVPALYQACGRECRSEVSPACLSNRRDWPCPTLPRQPLRTGRRPMLSQETQSRHSGARWNSGRWTNRPASGRVVRPSGDRYRFGKRRL